MQPKAGKDQNAHLYDMLESARVIQRYMEGVTDEQFWENGEKRDAVAMRLATIGDAARHITKDTAAAIPAIPFNGIQGMRNRIAHDYGKVNFREVWKVTQQDIKPLITALEGYFEKQGLAATVAVRPKPPRQGPSHGMRM
jgi:uncharacterized protein with HEPN domain